MPIHGPIRAALLIAAATVAPPPALADDPPAASPETIEFFETRVRPVLAEKCLSCHGATKQKSELRLDSREAVLRGGFLDGPSVYLDDPAGSPLILAVKREGTVSMPPDEPLDAGAVADLERWIGMGMPWPDDLTIPTPEQVADAGATHWAFQPVADPEPPAVSDGDWVATPIDAFILARLDEAGLTPSAPADRRTLIRRATFDLIGLPPTPEEVEAFVNDARPDAEAFAEVVDRLLASPHYGERWGRHWLDVARYGDTKGYVFTAERRYPYSYTYRDYVVRSFNEDKPFDEFLVEQIAADKLGLPEGDPDLAAMGFLTVGRRFLNSQHDIIDDRIDVVTRGMMGLTVTCARCHDHKYDPIPTADYYSLYGVFASSTEPELPPLIQCEDEGGPERAEFDAKVAELQGEIDAFRREKRDAYAKDYRERLAVYLDAAREMEFQPSPRRGGNDEVARAHELSNRRLGRFIDRWSALLDRTRDAHDPIFAPWHALAALPAEQFAERAPGALDEVLADEANPVNPAIAAALREPGPPATFAEAVARYADALTAGGEEPGRAELNALLEAEDGPFVVAVDEVNRLLERDERNALQDREKKLDQLRVTHPGAPPRAMVMVDSDRMMNPYVFIRGSQGNRGPEVPRRFLELLEGEDRKPFEDGSGRLELARKVADPENPLTSRVMVNRIWSHHFGRPIVGTMSDFGTRSDPPTHPQLLDFLARRFVDGGWSVKAIHRLVMNSNAYRQRSLDRPECVSVDPENFLLWRQNRQRLELEPMRDALLAVAGRLDRTLGGRPVGAPSEPDGSRRTLYSFVDRSFLDGVYRTFDFASPEASSPGRPATTVPQQALFLMNSPFVVRRASELARRAAAEAGDSADPAAKVDRLYRLLFGRPPEPDEAELGLRFLASQGELTAPPKAPWTNGYGAFDESTGRVVSFTPFPHWTGEAWQFGPELPDPDGAYLNLRANGGHVGNDPEHAAIRRWVAPADMVVAIGGTLRHPKAEGDGVRARVVASEGGPLGEWIAHDDRAETAVDRYAVKVGESIDFVVDCRTGPSHDSFEWAPTIRVLEGDGAGNAWAARDDFAGPPPSPPTPEEQYAQALLMTNEFLFVD